MIYHYTDEEYDEAKAFEVGCQAEYEDYCKAEKAEHEKKWPVQNLHTPHGKPVLPPIKGRSMTQ